MGGPLCQGNGVRQKMQHWGQQIRQGVSLPNLPALSDLSAGPQRTPVQEEPPPENQEAAREVPE
jgi:hypothetical protein